MKSQQRRHSALLSPLFVEFPQGVAQALVTLGDDEPALRLAVAATILVGDEAQRRARNSVSARDNTSGKLRSPRGPRRRHATASYARHQLRRVEGAKGEAESDCTELSVESPVGARAYTAEAQQTMAAWRHSGEAQQRVTSAEKRRRVAM
jgi:hypothetical protein